MLKIVSFTCYVILLFILPGHALSSSYEKAHKYFSTGDYEKAIEIFHQMEKKNQPAMTVYFNLASAYYKSGNYEKAELYYKKSSAFEKIKALAVYNLGLVSLKLGEDEKAEIYFRQVINLTNEEKLKRLAEKQLTEKNVKPWSLYLKAGIGWDDNVNFSATGNPLNVSDTFLNYIASGKYLVSGSGQNGWWLKGAMYGTDYQSSLTSSSDYYQFGMAIEKVIKENNLMYASALMMDKSGLGKFEYQTILGFQALVEKRLEKKQSLSMRYRYQDVQSDNWAYDYLEGWRQEVRMQYEKKTETDKQRYYYEIEQNKRNDTSFSPLRHTIRGYYTYSVSNELKIKADIMYRQSNYETVGSWFRKDERVRGSIQTEYKTGKESRVYLKWDYLINESNLPDYDYTRNVISLNLGWLF